MSELKEIGIRWEENGELHFSHVYLKFEVDKYIEKLKDDQRWREFSEEKPEHHQRILVCSRDYKTELRRWDEGCKFDVEVQEIYTHWMPLPKEPEDF